MNKLVLLTAVLVVAVVLAFPFAYRASAEPVTVCVDSKERVVEAGADVSSKYLVFGDNEVFEVTDSFIFFTWNASDRYNALKQGQCYDVTAAGWRIPFFSAYRNIVRVDSVG